MKKKLQEMLEAKEARKQGLVQKGQTSEDAAELRSINLEMENLNADITEIRAMLQTLEEPEEKRFKPLDTYGLGGKEKRGSEEEDPYGTVEYRQAFKNYVLNGTPIPAEYRADALTVTKDVGAVIPTTILNQVIEDMTVEGKIIGRITQTNYQGGVSIPISDIMPEATWLESEEQVSDEQKADMNAKITFSYYTLEAKVAIGLMAATVSLPIFEATVVKQLKKAMIKAIETAIISGTGTGQPLGCTKYTLPAANIATMNQETIGTVAAWAEVEGMIPEAVEGSAIYVMAKATWEKYLNGMTDKNGQKIGLGKLNEKGVKVLNGREVMTVDKLPTFDAASNGDIFALIIDFDKYMLNSNLAMYYKKYWDEEKNKWVHKALMIADGKMAIGEVGEGSSKKLVGAQNLIYIKKGAAPAPSEG